MVETLAAFAATILLLIAFHQVALAFGAPLTEPTYKGDPQRHSQLTGGYRIASAFAAAVAVLAAYIVASRGDVIANGVVSERTLTWGTWIVGGYLSVNALTDLASADRIQRWLGSIAKSVTAFLCVIVAIQSA